MKYRVALLTVLALALASPARADNAPAKAADDDEPCKLIKTVICYDRGSGVAALVIKSFKCTDGTSPLSCFDEQGDTTVCPADCPVGTSPTPPDLPSTQ